MKDLSIKEKKTKTNKNLTSPKIRRTKVIIRVRAKAPAASSPEIPILYVISKDSENGMRTKDVLREVGSARWFGKLDDDDRRARYPSSRKKIVDSVIKFARKNLVLKGEIFPAGDGKTLGTWRITRKGLGRAAMERDEWSPRYSTHDAIIIEEEK